MTAEIVVVGAGGFGREVLDVIEAMNAVQPTWTVLGVADGSPRPADVERLQRRGIRLLGADDKVLADCSPTHFVVGIGSPAIRREVAEKFESHGWMPATVAHPSATTGADVELGGGTVIWLMITAPAPTLVPDPRLTSPEIEASGLTVTKSPKTASCPTVEFRLT